jgi:hypothetical protein
MNEYTLILHKLFSSTCVMFCFDASAFLYQSKDLQIETCIFLWSCTVLNPLLKRKNFTLQGAFNKLLGAMGEMVAEPWCRLLEVYTVSHPRRWNSPKFLIQWRK